MCCLKFRYEVDKKNPPENRKSSCTFENYFKLMDNPTTRTLSSLKGKKQGLEEFPERN